VTPDPNLNLIDVDRLVDKNMLRSSPRKYELSVRNLNSTYSLNENSKNPTQAHADPYRRL